MNISFVSCRKLRKNINIELCLTRNTLTFISEDNIAAQSDTYRLIQIQY